MHHQSKEPVALANRHQIRRGGYSAALVLLASILIAAFQDGDNLSLSVVAVPLLVVGFLVCLCISGILSVVPFLPLVQSLVLISASGLLIESGEYVSEQSRDGYVTGGTLRYLPYGMAALGASVWMFRRMTRDCETRGGSSTAGLIDGGRDPVMRLIGGLGIGVLAMVTLVILRSGNAYSLGLDRVTYRAAVMTGIKGVAYGYMMQWCVFWGMLQGCSSSGLRRLGWIGLAWQSALQFLSGERYSGLYSAALLFGLGAYSSIRSRFVTAIDRQHWWKGVLVGVIVVGALAASIVFNYRFNERTDVVYTESMMQRLVLDGHVWWGIDQQVFARTGEKWGGEGILANEARAAMGDIPFLGSALQGQIFPSGVGMDLLMQDVAPPALVEHYRDIGFRFSNGMAAYLIRLFGYVGGWIGAALMGIAFGVIVGLIVRATQQGSILGALASSKLYVVMLDAMVQASFYRLFSPRTLLLVAFLAFVCHRTVGGRPGIVKGAS